MQNQGLLFIPDISGFTKFITETEIDHSRMIIQELLELLISNNELDLEISEIEGDAILFYRFGDSPKLEEVYKQVEKMFCEFHRHLSTYDVRKFCQCKACVAASHLSLKIITHYGEFTGYTVRNFSKLLGKDVIVAHQLLKNDIPQHEYWLVTKEMIKENKLSPLTEWMKWESSSKQTEEGEIIFEYAQLGPLKKRIPPDPPLQLELKHKKKLFEFTRVYNTHIVQMFHAAGDFNYRSRWKEGVKSVEELGHYLPRLGTKCKCVLDDGEVVLYSSSFSYNDGRVEFSDTDEKKESATYYILDEIDPDTTKLTVEFYVEEELSGKFDADKLKSDFEKSLDRLERLVAEIDIPRMGC